MTNEKFVPVLQECLLNEYQLNGFIDGFFCDEDFGDAQNDEEKNELHVIKKKAYNRVKQDLPNAIGDILKEFSEECEFELKTVPNDTK